MVLHPGAPDVQAVQANDNDGDDVIMFVGGPLAHNARNTVLVNSFVASPLTQQVHQIKYYRFPDLKIVTAFDINGMVLMSASFNNSDDSFENAVALVENL